MEQQYPLHVAAGRGLLPIVKHMIEVKGMDVNSVASERMNWTPLHYAAYYNKPEVVSYLLSRKARKDLKNMSGRTPMDISADIRIQRLLA